MFWLAWIGWAVVFAVLFSVVKALDRLNHSVELIDARLDHLAGRLAEVLASPSVASAPGRIERGASVTDSLLEFASDTRSAKELERSAGR
jgi:hypothetical protein